MCCVGGVVCRQVGALPMGHAVLLLIAIASDVLSSDP